MRCEKTGSDDEARDFVAKLFANVPVLDGGGRGATTTFTQRDIGDVLVTFENEAVLIGAGTRRRQVRHRLSLAQHRGAAHRSQSSRRSSTSAARARSAEAYLDFLFSPEGQEIIAKHHFRPRDAAVLKDNAGRFPAIKTFTVETLLGGWAEVQASTSPMAASTTRSRPGDSGRDCPVEQPRPASCRVSGSGARASPWSTCR